MPMDLNRYPTNWKSIAATVKDCADWTCEECDRPCRRPNEDEDDLCDRLNGSEWSKQLYEEVYDDEFGTAFIPKFGRFTLTVAHLDHIPENCDRDNLKALCTVCHCRMDLKAMEHKQHLERERQGQLNLFSTGEK